MNSYFRPSTSKDEISDHSDFEYYHAENLGKEGAPCDRVFNECKASMLEQFSGIYTPMVDLLKYQ